MGDAANQEQQKRKRKKKSFLANARSFAKKQCFGRGTEVEQDVYNYFLNIITIVRSEENPQTVEDKIILANNALEDYLETFVKLASNQVCSRAVEHLIPFTGTEMLETILTKISEDFRIICTDQYASHILEKLLFICLLRGSVWDASRKLDDQEIKHNLETDWSTEHKSVCRNFVIKTSKFMVNNLEDFVWDSFASHVIRRCLHCLAGLVPLVNKKNKKQTEEYLNLTVEDEWAEVLKEFAERLVSWPQFADLPYNEYTSGILQYLSLGLRHTNKSYLKTFGKKLLHDAFLSKTEEEELHSVFTTEPSIRLLEVLLSVAGPKLMTQLNAMLFTGKLKTLSTHKSANFAVQKLLANVKEEQEFEVIFEEMIPLLEEILQLNYTGVVMALAEACRRLKTKQGQFIQAIQKVLNCEKKPPVPFFICLSKLKSSADCEKDTSNFVHLHGSLIIQAILNYNKPIKFVQNLLEIKANALLKIFTDPKGSHIVDSFMQSEFVGEQSKQKFVKHFEGLFSKFATSKHGSQALEAMFNGVATKIRPLILDELADSLKQVNGSPFGQIICKKFSIEMYKTNRKRWDTMFNKAKVDVKPENE